MYTVLWRDNGQDRYDRLETREDVENLLKEIDANPEASPLGDIWVYGPEADNYVVTGDTFGRNTFHN